MVRVSPLWRPFEGSDSGGNLTNENPLKKNNSSKQNPHKHLGIFEKKNMFFYTSLTETPSINPLGLWWKVDPPKKNIFSEFSDIVGKGNAAVEP